MVRAAAPRPLELNREQLRPRLRAALAVATTVSVVVFVALAVVLWDVHGKVGLDGTYTLELYSVRLKHVTRFGSPQLVGTVTGLLAIVSLVRRDLFGAVLCAVGPALAGVFEIGAKHVVGRMVGHNLSYPSGHAALSASLAAVIAVLAFRTFTVRGAALLTAAVAVVPVAVSIALVRLGWHFPTDVVGGCALGVAIAGGLALLLDLASRRMRTN